MSITLSPNMNLPVPGVGTEAGPAYATDINNCLSILDAHDHTPGNGVQLTPSSLSINADLPMHNNNLTLVRTIRFQAQGSVPAGASDLGCLYSQGVDLYFIDGSGNNVRITQGGAVAGTPGSIANLTSPASAAYVSANSTFVFQSAANTPANIDGASFLLRNLSANSKALTLAPPSAMAADFSITLPALPGQNSAVVMNTSGAMSAILLTASYFDAATAASLCPAGVVIAYGGSSAPTGWLLCDGSAVSRSTYAGLFAIVGTTYGSGDGSTTFNIPDTRGIFLRGAGANGTLTNANGASFSATLGAYQNDQFQSHIHTFAMQGSPGANGNPANGTNAPTTTNNRMSVPVTDGSDGDPRTGVETRPANVGMNFIIKT